MHGQGAVVERGVSGEGSRRLASVRASIAPRAYVHRPSSANTPKEVSEISGMP